jgi:hypothetical protein
MVAIADSVYIQAAGSPAVTADKPAAWIYIYK